MSRNKPQQNTLTYSAVEAALCDVFDIGKDSLTNFRARIRHLRNIGVPSDLPRLGPGKKVKFTLNQVLQMAFALLLEEHGVTPRWAADAGPDIVSAARWMRASNPHDDWYAVFSRESLPPEPAVDLGMNYTLLPSFERLQARLKDEFIDHKGAALLVINVSNLTRKVEQAFQERVK